MNQQNKPQTTPFDAMQLIESLTIEVEDKEYISGTEKKFFRLEIKINDLPPLCEYIERPVTIAEFACRLEGYAQLLRNGPPQ